MALKYRGLITIYPNWNFPFPPWNDAISKAPFLLLPPLEGGDTTWKRKILPHNPNKAMTWRPKAGLRFIRRLSPATRSLAGRGNRHQQSGMGTTVGAPIRLKHNVPRPYHGPGEISSREAYKSQRKKQEKRREGFFLTRNRTKKRGKKKGRKQGEDTQRG